MTLHLIKLSVGTEGIADLAHWQEQRIAMLRKACKAPDLYHRTRQMPRRSVELLNGGSIYWVIKGVVLARQKLLDFRAVTGDDGVPRCDIILEPGLIPTRPQPRRAFQGWRYLKPDDAPPDLGKGANGLADLPEEMRSELMELGLL
ncbi:MAG: DUF1489 family protein [Hyphomicrobiales bacterium]